MSKRYFAAMPDVCALLDTKATKICLPIKIDCGIPPDGIVVKCGDEHNCTDCCHNPAMKYFMPFNWDDCFDFILNVFDKYNPDQKNPTDGFGTWIEYNLIDLATGEEVALNPESYYVGWNGKKSYQVFRICLLENEVPECWQLKFKVYDDEENLVNELCTQHFKLADPCLTTALISSKRDGFDCEGNYYDLPEASAGDTPFKYNNTLRFYVDIKDTAPVRETVTRGGINRKQRIKYIKEYSFLFVPLYVVKYLTNRIEYDGYIDLDGKSYEAEFTDVEQIEDTCMYNIRINIVYECKEDNC